MIIDIIDAVIISMCGNNDDFIDEISIFEWYTCIQISHMIQFYDAYAGGGICSRRIV